LELSTVGHDPEILQVRVRLWTHAINGLAAGGYGLGKIVELLPDIAISPPSKLLDSSFIRTKVYIVSAAVSSVFV
jgi:hypothetical protein